MESHVKYISKPEIIHNYLYTSSGFRLSSSNSTRELPRNDPRGCNCWGVVLPGDCKRGDDVARDDGIDGEGGELPLPLLLLRR